MWQITWMLSLLPDWFWWIILITGVAALVLSWARTPYKVPLKIGGLIAIFVGTFMVGMAANEAKWEARVKELEQKLLVAESASKQVNEVIVEKVVTETRVVKEKGRDIVKYIDRWNTKEVVVEGPERIKIEEVIKFVEICPLPAAVIEAHDAAATLNKAAQGPTK